MVQPASVWHTGPAMTFRGPGSFGREWRVPILHDNSSILICIYLYVIIFINHFLLGSSIDTLTMLPAFSLQSHNTAACHQQWIDYNIWPVDYHQVELPKTSPGNDGRLWPPLVFIVVDVPSHASLLSTGQKSFAHPITMVLFLGWKHTQLQSHRLTENPLQVKWVGRGGELNRKGSGPPVLRELESTSRV